MKFIKILVKSVVVLVIVLAVVGFFLPSASHIERTISVSASADKIFPYLSNFNQFNRWSPWAAIDPNTKYTFQGPEQGVGARMRWQSEHPNVGNGSQEIVALVPDQSVDTKLEFQGQGGAMARFEISPTGEQSAVTWKFHTDWGYNLMGRYMGLMMDKWVGGEYEKGLASLKALAESE